ncbi:MAG: carbohydrate porin [Bryobacterales bacterium]|nr:carbohydrate porin [Bryobacterales bacterium]
MSPNYLWSSIGKLRHCCAFFLIIATCSVGAASAEQAAADRTVWREAALAELSRKYLEQDLPADLTPGEASRWIGKLFQEVGRRLAEGDAALPAEDVALASWLYASGASGRGASSPAVPAASPPRMPQAPSPSASTAAATVSARRDLINKGDEGFRQGVEGLADAPIGERLVMTGDVTAGAHAATVPGNADLTSAFGRARINFVLLALPEALGGRLSKGYFFVQLRSAGGPFDTSAVGGPASFTALNDVARDRSRFNDGTSRGDVYLSKAFYEQRLRVRDGEIRGRAGLVNLTDFFDTNLFANNEARQFLNGAFTNGAAFKTGISAPGAIAEYDRSPWLLKAPWLDRIVLRAGYILSQTERAFTSPLWAGELELATTLRGQQGHWRFGGTAGNVADAGSVSTFHVSADQWLSRRIGVFGRYGFGSTGAGGLRFGPVRWAYSGGVQWKLTDEQERVSAWSVGFSQAFPTESPERPVSEKVLETFYRWQMTRNAALSPSFQLVGGSGGQTSKGLHTVYGLRLFFTY